MEKEEKEFSVMDLVPIAKLPLLNRRRKEKVPVKSLKEYIADEYKLVKKLDDELKETLFNYNKLQEKHEKLKDEYDALLVVNGTLDERVKSKSREIEAYESTISRLKLDIKTQKEEYKSQIADLKITIKDLEKEIRMSRKSRNKKEE